MSEGTFLLQGDFPLRGIREAEESRDIVAVGTSKALTSGSLPPLWQVPLSLLEAAARRYGKGNDKGYPIHNWRGGLDDAAFLRDRANHAATHFYRLLNGDNSVDDAQGNVDALIWFGSLACEALRLHPDTWAAAFYAEARNEKLNTNRT